MALRGSAAAVAAASAAGAELKLAISGLCDDLGPDPGAATPHHEIFLHTHSHYYFSKSGLFKAASHPLVRVEPRAPMTFRTGNWDVGWAVAWTDGRVAFRRCDPYTLGFTDVGALASQRVGLPPIMRTGRWEDDDTRRCAIRWFAR
jgi:hypothetical protein